MRRPMTVRSNPIENATHSTTSTATKMLNSCFVSSSIRTFYFFPNAWNKSIESSDNYRESYLLVPERWNENPIYFVRVLERTLL